MKLKPDQFLYVRALGKAVRVTAIFTSDAQANQHMKANEGDAVVACMGGMILIANKNDDGVKIEDPELQQSEKGKKS